MQLIERDDVLAQLDLDAAAATTGHGRLAFVSGEAGLGKSSVATAVLERHPDMRHLVGGCDALTTPRPLGPLWDMGERSSDVADILGLGAQHDRFARFLDLLATPGRPSLVVIEDLHWADGATLDLLRFLGRRIRRTHALVIGTYRSDEVTGDHPMRSVLGTLATSPDITRVELTPLSLAGVALLARGRSIDPRRLHARTAGNPFFVSEVLLHPRAEIPETVREVVLARRAGLAAGGRATLDAVSIVPRATERWLLDGIVDVRDEDIDACVAAGALSVDDRGALQFRHELARLAVHAAVPPARRAHLHELAMRALIDAGERRADPARIVHHAAAAGNGEVVVAHALDAARRASAAGAHRQARDHLELALRFPESLDDLERAAYLEELTVEASVTGDATAALDAATGCLAIRRNRADDRAALATTIRMYGMALWEHGDGPGAHRALQEAVALVAGTETPAAAAVLASHTALMMLARRCAPALEVGRDAIGLATRMDARAALTSLLNSVGVVEILVGDVAQGTAHLRRALDVARAGHMDREVAVALLNLGSALGEVRAYATAEQYLREAIAFSTARDLDYAVWYQTAWLARVLHETGRWTEAVACIATLPVEQPQTSPIVTITALAVRGRILAARGEPGSAEALDRAWELAVATDDLQRLWPVAAARAEAALLAGADDQVEDIVGDTLDRALTIGHPWAVGELGVLRMRAGRPDPRPDVVTGAAEPYRCHMTGDIAGAARAWAEIGCPVDQANALADGDEQQQLEALAVLDELGAIAAAARVRRRLRSAGVRSIPRGRYAGAASHPAGLTAREAEILELVAEGLTNAAIAERLFISQKTAGNHVSAILAKLGVTSRQEAAACRAAWDGHAET